MARPGTLTISLDFELSWGVRDSRGVQAYADHLQGARAAIPQMLALFERNDIHATWATVGFLFFGSRDDLLGALPSVVPHYERPELSPYPDLASLGATESDEPMRLARSIVQRIAATPHQEVATHTFSHYYGLEPGQDEAAFRADLAAAAAAAEQLGASLQSIVFPRNQVCEAYFEALRDAGIIAFRGNEQAWMYQGSDKAGNTLAKRAARLADAHVDLTGHHGSTPTATDGLVNVPASRFLRPVHKRWGARQTLRRRRTLQAMTRAAELGEVFHLWWHPHNFGAHPEANLSELDRILQHYTRLRDRYGMASESMAEVARRVLAQQEPQRAPRR